MKIPNLITGALLAGVTTLLVSSLTASAAVLTADNPDTVVNDTSITIGSDGIGGYFFSQVVPDPVPNDASGTDIYSYADAPYVASVVPSLTPFAGGSSDSAISVDGTNYYTGVYYTNAGSSTYQTVATINLSDVTPGAALPTFTLGVLTGATSADRENDDLYQLSLYSSTGTLLGNSPLQVNNVTDTANPTTDDFFYATVAGAIQGDYLVLTAARNPTKNDDGSYATGSNIVFGGVTFSASVPEPSTYALMFAGLGILVLVARLRRRNA